jgi:DNA-binding NarL/FixJ family response regulator
LTSARGPTVLVADDHAPLRRGVRVALQNGGFRVVAECADAATAMEAAIRLRPDVCLLDIQMPGNGIVAAREISARVPTSKIVMLTVSEDDEDLFAAIQAGAISYLIKGSDPVRLGGALQAVLSGEAVLPPTLVARLIGEFRRRSRRAERLRELELEGIVLTRREWDVLELLAEGRSTSEIAAVLYISPATVRSHVASTLKKLHAGSREEALKRLE